MDLGSGTRQSDGRRPDAAGHAPSSDRRRRWGRRARDRVDLAEVVAGLAFGDPAPRPEPEVGIDPVERALLIQLYKELVGTVEGPIVPFPVELMEDPVLVADRSESASLLDLDAFRRRRHASSPAHGLPEMSPEMSPPA